MDPRRLKLLKVALAQPHRYRRARAVTMSLTVALLFAVPLFDVARIDLFGGRHAALGRPMDLGLGTLAVVLAIAAFYFLTFVINILAGRMFCGFGCPVGQLSRFADAIDVFEKAPTPRRRAWANLLGLALVLSVAAAFWVTSPATFMAWPAALAALAGTEMLTAYAVFHARRFRWQFCRKLCPIGLYYSVVQTSVLVGIDFDPARTCTDCDACRGICPVHLDPRHLDAPLPAPGGLALDGFPSGNHCLHCAQCVEICEFMTRKAGGSPAMGLRRLRPHPAPAGDEATAPAIRRSA